MAINSKSVENFLRQENEYKGKSILSNVNIENLDIKGIEIRESLQFHRCNFTQSVNLENLNLHDKLIFSNCTFNGRIEFSNIKNNSEEQQYDLSEIRINDCEIKNILSFNTIEINKLYLENLPQIESLFIKVCKIATIRFYNIPIIKSNYFDGLICLEKTDFIKCKFTNDCYHINTKICKLSWNSCEFNMPIMLLENFITEDFDIYECDFNEYVSIKSPIEDQDINGKMKIERSRFKKDLYYDYSEKQNKFFNHKNFYFDNNTVSENFTLIYYQDINNISENKAILEDLELNFTSKNESLSKLSYLSFKKITIKGNNNKGSLQISNIDCHNIHFDKLINLGNILMINCFNNKGFVYDKFKISNSLLNNLTLLNVNLSTFQQTEITESSLNNIKANNTIFFNFNKLGGKGDYKKRNILIRFARWLIFLFFRSRNSMEIKFWENKREVYKQLKQSMEQNGDRIHALDFKSFEMKAHRKFLILTKGVLNSNRIILMLSSTNDFGLNWIKALILCIITMGTFYVVLLVQTDPDLGFNLNKSYMDLTLKKLSGNFNIFFQILNPIHDVKRVFDGMQINNWTYFFDYFSRIAMSFFIFQIVSAFRKYIK